MRFSITLLRLPALLHLSLLCIFMLPFCAGDSGVIWLVASFIDSYALCKCKQPKRWGLMIALLVTISLWIGGAYGIWKGYLIHA
jgi:hypothetical protein